MKSVWDIIIGILFLLYSLSMNIIIGRVIDISWPFFIGGLLLIIYHFIKRKITNKIVKGMMITLIVLISSIFIVTEAIIIGTPKIDRQNADYIVVLGSGNNYKDRVDLTTRYRLDNVVDLIYKYCNDSYIVVSNGEDVSKSKQDTEMMKKYLMDQGINENKILIEDNSSDIEECMEYSKKIIEEHSGQNIDDVNVKIVTSDYNSYRCKLMAKKMGYKKINTNSSGSDIYFTIASYFSEPIKLIKLLIS